MANDTDVGFFYQLGVETNLDEVTKQLKGLNTVANKTVAGITAGLGGLKLFSNQFRDLDVLSRKLQVAPEYIRQIGFEFDALGFSMQDGLGLVDKLATSLKDLEFKGQFNEAFARVGIRLDEGDTTENLIQKLRKAYAGDSRRFTAFAGDIGLSDAETGFITQSQAEFKRNRAFAREQVGKEDLGALIQNEKDLNQNLANLTASVTRLGDEILSNVDKLIPVIDFLSDNLKAVAVGLVALKVGGGVAGAIAGGGAKGKALKTLGKFVLPVGLGIGAYQLGKLGIDELGKTGFGQNIGDTLLNSMVKTREAGFFSGGEQSNKARKNELLRSVIIEQSGAMSDPRKFEDYLDKKGATNNNNFTFNMMTQDNVDRTLEVINLTMEE